jgi:AraC-like DNA-binding protein
VSNKDGLGYIGMMEEDINHTDVLVPSILITKVIKFAIRSQVDVRPLLDTLDYDPSPQSIYQSTVTLQQLCELIQNIRAEAKHDIIGLYFGDSFAFEYLPEMETFLTTSASVWEALKVFNWAGPLLIPFASFNIKVEGDQFGLVMSLSPDIPEDVSAIVVEAFASVVYKFGRMLLADEFAPTKVEFKHDYLGDKQAYTDFLKTPVVMNAEDNVLWVQSALLSMQFKNHLPELHEQAKEELQKRLLAIQPENSIAKQIYSLIQQNAHYLNADIQVFADMHHVTVRTLQRQLKLEGTTFRMISEQAKYALACDLLKNTPESIESISEKLGFSDRRSFTRSFVRWGKKTPSMYRKEQS